MSGLLLLAAGCEGDGHLRGHVTASRDGHTYLAIEDDNGGHCGDLIIDGAVWQRSPGVAAPISPGLHDIDCGSLANYRPENAIRFEIPAGVVFHFDYWGP